MTVLFTDFDGLTRRLHEIPPEEFRALVADYHRTLERVLTDTGGTGVVSFSDTAVTVYRSARQAVAAAAGLQRIVASHEWPGGSPIRVAIALDSGEVIATGHGVFGEAVNRCAKLCGVARGGEVLPSEAARSLLEGEDLGELELLEVEERPLKAGGRPLRIYRLIVPALPAGAEPPISARGQMPTGAEESIESGHQRGGGVAAVARKLDLLRRGTTR